MISTRYLCYLWVSALCCWASLLTTYSHRPIYNDDTYIPLPDADTGSLKRKCRHFDEQLVPGIDNFRFSQWRNCRQNYHISLKVYTAACQDHPSDSDAGWNSTQHHCLRGEGLFSLRSKTFHRTISWILEDMGLQICCRVRPPHKF